MARRVASASETSRLLAAGCRPQCPGDAGVVEIDDVPEEGHRDALTLGQGPHGVPHRPVRRVDSWIRSGGTGGGGTGRLRDLRDRQRPAGAGAMGIDGAPRRDRREPSPAGSSPTAAPGRRPEPGPGLLGDVLRVPGTAESVGDSATSRQCASTRRWKGGRLTDKERYGVPECEPCFTADGGRGGVRHRAFARKDPPSAPPGYANEGIPSFRFHDGHPGYGVTWTTRICVRGWRRPGTGAGWRRSPADGG